MGWLEQKLGQLLVMHQPVVHEQDVVVLVLGQDPDLSPEHLFLHRVEELESFK